MWHLPSGSGGQFPKAVVSVVARHRHKACILYGTLNRSRVRGLTELDPLPFNAPPMNGSLNGGGSRSAEWCKPLLRWPRVSGPVSMLYLKPNLRRANESVNTGDHVDLGSIASHPPLRWCQWPANCHQAQRRGTGIDDLRC